MSLLIVLASLLFLMVVAYRGYSVILFAPVAAMGAVFFTDPSLVAPMFTGLFMEKLAAFLKLYFPVFLLGAVFGKLIEISGFSKSIVSSIVGTSGSRHAMLSIVLVCALMTYGGVSLFVVVFAVYPFAAETFRMNNIPKRLIPATIALGAFSFTMDALPGTPQIQNIIPIQFFKTNIYAAPMLGLIGSVFILLTGLAYLNWCRRRAEARKEGYGTVLLNEPEAFTQEVLPHPLIALIPLLLVGVMNKVFTVIIPQFYGESHSFNSAVVAASAPVTQEVSKIAAIWGVQGALLTGILAVVVLARRRVISRFSEASKSAVSGSLLAAMNTASEYGFGAVIAALPGFLVLAEALKSIPHPLVNEAVTVTTLAGITGSASGGLSIALAAMAESFLQAAEANGIPAEVLHRVASMASGGMDTLPHNGAVITLLTVTGLTHRQAYRDIFVITCLKTIAVFVVIAVFAFTGIV
ncbi:GntP family permease [Planctomicrobium sp. SH527]|uniref:GntP family permease n=1 Tax=Planctomicrobium sp. SH527 TaxID=3448123 RepID=UPI003F5B3251